MCVISVLLRGTREPATNPISRNLLTRAAALGIDLAGAEAAALAAAGAEVPVELSLLAVGLLREVEGASTTP